MKVLIIEDEKIAADNLQILIREIDSQIEVLATIETVRDAVKWLSENKADLLFLDIHLSDGSSFGIFKQIHISTPVIFTTAYDSYAIQAFKVNSIDYLLKPIDKQELTNAINKYKNLHKPTTNTEDLHNVLKQITATPEYRKRFMVYAGQKLKSIKTTEIAYFSVSDKNTFLTTFKNTTYSLDYSLDQLEELLDPELFFRVNRKYLVHLDAIDEMYLMSKSRIQLNIKPLPESNVFVSYNRAANFRKWLNR